MNLKLEDLRPFLREKGLEGRAWRPESASGFSLDTIEIKTKGIFGGFLGRVVAELNPPINTGNDVQLCIHDTSYKTTLYDVISSYDMARGTKTKVEETDAAQLSAFF